MTSVFVRILFLLLCGVSSAAAGPHRPGARPGPLDQVQGPAARPGPLDRVQGPGARPGPLDRVQGPDQVQRPDRVQGPAGRPGPLDRVQGPDRVQRPDQVQGPNQVQRPAARPGPLDQVQEPAALQQEKQSYREPLAWRYPSPPAAEDPRFPPHFELETPAAADSVSVVCLENSVRVEAKKDLLGIGKDVLAADVSLGGCPASEENPKSQILVFESELHGCGSQLLMSEDSFVYEFTLLYTPSPLGGSQIIRTRDVSVSIQCHYQRKHDVSSELVNPTWTPFSDFKSSEENLHFSIQLLTADLLTPRPSSEFVLGDMMTFEVSVRPFHHAGLRVLVDGCTATVVQHVDTVPRYAFLGNHGCLFDSQLTGSTSRFLPRSEDDRLRFQVEAFRFQQDDSGVIYITCSVRATLATAAVDATNKACSFIDGWMEASGRHQVCSCCDSDCKTGSHLTGSHLTGTVDELEQEVAVGPITVKERPL